MLKENTYKVGDIITLSLQTGQEVLGKFVSEDEDYTVIAKPLTIAVGPQGAAFQPFTVTGDSEKSVQFKTDKVIAVLGTNNQTTDAYIQATTTIITPENGKILQ